MTDRDEGSPRLRRERAPGSRARGREPRRRHAADGDLRFTRAFSIAFETLGARAAALLVAPLAILFLVGGGIALAFVLVAQLLTFPLGPDRADFTFHAVFVVIASLLYLPLFSFLLAFMTDVAHAHIAGRSDTWTDSLGTGALRALSVAAILLLVVAALVLLLVGIGAAAVRGPTAVVVSAFVLGLLVATVGVTLWTAIPACVVEGRGAFASLTRSFRTVRDNLRRILPIALVTILVGGGAIILLRNAISAIDSPVASLLAVCFGLLLVAIEVSVATATYHILSGPGRAADVDADVFA